MDANITLTPVQQVAAKRLLDGLRAGGALTGADLRAIVEDGKLLYARDLSRGKPLRAVEDYFLEALDIVRANRRNYARRKPSPVTDDIKLGFVAD